MRKHVLQITTDVSKIPRDAIENPKAFSASVPTSTLLLALAYFLLIPFGFSAGAMALLPIATKTSSVAAPGWIEPIATIGSLLPFFQPCADYLSTTTYMSGAHIQMLAFIYGGMFLLGILLFVPLTPGVRGAAFDSYLSALHTNVVNKRKYDLTDLIVWEGSGIGILIAPAYFFLVGDVMSHISKFGTFNFCIMSFSYRHIYISVISASYVVFVFGTLIGLLFISLLKWIYLKRQHCIGWQFRGAEKGADVNAQRGSV